MADTQARGLFPAPPESNIAAAERDLFTVVAAETLDAFSYNSLLNLLCAMKHTKPAAQHAIRRSIEAGRLGESIHYINDWEHGDTVFDPQSTFEAKELSVTDQFWVDYYKQAANDVKPTGGEAQQNSPPVPVCANRSKVFPNGELADRNLVEFIYNLDAKRSSGASDNEIAREYTMETSADDTKAQRLLARYRKGRLAGKVGI